MENHPIIAVNYVLDGTQQVYHTDGQTLKGPSVPQSGEMFPLDKDTNALGVSYLTMINPDHKGNVYYQPVIIQKFSSVEDLKEGITDLILEYQDFYQAVLKQIPFEQVDPMYKTFSFTYPTLQDLEKII